MGGANPDPHGETSDDILSFLNVRGFNLTARQLKRWHTEGLLPAPRQVHRFGQKDSTTVYPSGTRGQVAALAIIARAFKRRTLRGWYLWRLGFQVPETYWRPRLLLAAERLTTGRSAIVQIIDEVPDISDPAVAAIERHSHQAVSHPFAGRLKQQIGAHHLAAFLVDMVLMFGGEHPLWNEASASPDTNDESRWHFHRIAFQDAKDASLKDYAYLMKQIATQLKPADFFSMTTNDVSKLATEMKSLSMLTMLDQMIELAASQQTFPHTPQYRLFRCSLDEQAVQCLAWSLLLKIHEIERAVHCKMKKLHSDHQGKLW